MKTCPQCGNMLPEESHFCPKCMYEYERAETVVPEISAQCENKKKWNQSVMAVFVLLAVVTFLFYVILNNDKPSSNGHSENGNVVEESIKLLRTEADINTDVEVNYTIKYDMRNILPDLEDMIQFLGEPTEPITKVNEYDEYIYGDVEVLIDGAEVYDILIDYQEAESPDEYGLYGICGKTTRDEVKKILGTPNQDYGNEYSYYFDGAARGPMLKIWFDSKDQVECIEYYITL